MNIVANNKLIACYLKSCDIYQEGAWEHLQDTIEWRTYHSAVGLREKLLLIGGDNSDGSTEFIPVDGSSLDAAVARPKPRGMQSANFLRGIPQKFLLDS